MAVLTSYPPSTLLCPAEGHPETRERETHHNLSAQPKRQWLSCTRNNLSPQAGNQNPITTIVTIYCSKCAHRCLCRQWCLSTGADKCGVTRRLAVTHLGGMCLVCGYSTARTTLHLHPASTAEYSSTLGKHMVAPPRWQAQRPNSAALSAGLHNSACR